MGSARSHDYIVAITSASFSIEAFKLDLGLFPAHGRRSGAVPKLVTCGDRYHGATGCPSWRVPFGEDTFPVTSPQTDAHW